MYWISRFDNSPTCYFTFIGIIALLVWTASNIGAIIGVLVGSSSKAGALGGPANSLFILFNGFLVALNNLPKVRGVIFDA